MRDFKSQINNLIFDGPEVTERRKERVRGWGTCIVGEDRFGYCVVGALLWVENTFTLFSFAPPVACPLNPVH